jgi:hypothetical protein
LLVIFGFLGHLRLHRRLHHLTAHAVANRLWLGPLLADLDHARHVLELSSVLRDLAKVGLDLDFLPLLLLNFL